MLHFFRISKAQILIASFLSIVVLYRKLYKTKQALEKIRASHRELEIAIDLKNMALVKEEVLNRELRINLENFKSDKERLFSLIQKTLESKPIVTHEEVHQSISWSNSSIKSCQIDSSMTNRTGDVLRVLKTRELEEKNEELSIKLKRVTKILRENLSSDLEEGKHRFSFPKRDSRLRTRTWDWKSIK